MTETVRTFGVAGQEFEIDQPFKDGHVLNEAQANAMNKLFEENVRNNIRKSVETWVTEGKTHPEMQALVDEYCDKYEFGATKGGGKRIHDPVLREMRNLAIEAIKPILAKQNQNWANLTPEQKEDLLKRYLTKYETQVRAAAEAHLASVKQIKEQSLDF
jgi:hypothetical protein